MDSARVPAREAEYPWGPRTSQVSFQEQSWYSMVGMTGNSQLPESLRSPVSDSVCTSEGRM